MKNEQNDEPITSAEYFLMMRLLQTLEDEHNLPGTIDWQIIYSKLNTQCLAARKAQKA